MAQRAGGGALWTDGTGSGLADEELLVRAARDADAFAAFYDRREGQVLRYFVRLTGSHQLAAELHAETFAQALADVGRFDPERGTAGAWLFTIAAHQYHRYLRAGEVGRRYRQQEQIWHPGVALDETERVAEVTDAQVLLPHLLRAMDGLSEVVRSAVVLRVAHDLPYSEVAERLGCTEGTARVRVKRGLRRLRVTIVLAVVAVALVAGLGALDPSGGTAAAEVVVRIDGDEVVVTLEDLEHRPERIEAAARAAGLDVAIEPVPVGPSRVGRFLGQATSGPAPPQLRWVGSGPVGSRGFAIPVGWPGTLRLLVGVPAAADEPYAVFSDARLPGEPLACRDVLGRPARDVAVELQALGDELAVRWEAVQPARNELVEAAAVRVGPEGSWPVVGAEATSHAAVVLRIAPPGSTAPRPEAGGAIQGCPR